mmetsp:Transcript_88911/g.160318  ORF Transcript_88911/g.160318 Transcript_88911/m.160318 type:complete len:1261 (-) Transcript_88911:145-3927(-)
MSDEKRSDCVKVAVRLRPLSNKELANDEKSIIVLEEQKLGTGSETGSVQISDPEGKDKPSSFAFDIVFGTETEQQDVFESVGKLAVDQTLNGYNGTIFAYGQTGSGKSWCMMGAGGEMKGIIPRVNEQIFVQIAAEQEAKSTRQFLVMCSFFEIYNEIIFDLLNPVQDRSKLGAGLQVKEHPVLGIYVKDLQEIVVNDADKLEKLMNTGTKNRAVSSTMMNAVSSRSHSIFTIKVHQKDEEDKSKNVFAKLNLVDLAGSERQKGTGASGQTLKEGANINKSLSALGNVINALVENANGKKVFVPFRNSKLTRVLQESLGGNSLCTMLATLSPAACNYEETMSTLRYANRAKAIKVSATKNEEASQISRLNAEIEELKKKLSSSADGGGGGNSLMAEEERSAMKEKFQAQLGQMQHMVSSTWEEKAKLSADHEAQLSKALDEHKRQAKAMQEECRKRLRLLEDQNDLELSIRGLMDTLQSLPSKAEGNESPSSSSTSPLRSCELPREWLKMVASAAEVVDALKQQQTMAMVFQGAFGEDLRLWVDGEEAADHPMARTGARRALTKLETLKHECEKLGCLEENGRSKAKEFAEAVREARHEWLNTGFSALTEELREPDVVGSDGTNGSGSPSDVSGLPPLHTQTLEDVGRIMLLIEQQAKVKAEVEFDSLSGLEARPLVELVLHGAELVPGAVAEPDDQLLRSFLGGSSLELELGGGEDGVAEDTSQPATRPPREERPLHEWVPDDADDSVEGTEYVLTRVLEMDSLNKKRSVQELLARPPPKFVHDVALLVQKATGFLPAMSQEWPDPREAKVDLLQYIADAVASSFGLESVDFDPGDVLKGKEVQKTLRLLQLLTMAGAKGQHLPNGGSPSNRAKAHRDRRKAAGCTRARDMPPFLEAVSRCLRSVLEKQAAAQDSGQASPTHELESNYRSLQDRLEEEVQLRKRHDEKLAQLQLEVEQTRSVLGQRTEQLEAAKLATVDADGRKAELRKKVDTCRSHLLEEAAKIEGDPEVARTGTELQKFTAASQVRSEEKARLLKDVKKLQQQQIESDTHRETLELEGKRMKLRLAQGLDGPQPVVQSEEILFLQAEKQKWDMKVATLEEKLRLISEADDRERKQEMVLNEEKKLQVIKHDDLQMQLQVIIEERDGLREGMDLLWQEKTRADEDLENLSEGYTNLSDRLFEKIEEARELEEQLQTYDNFLSMVHDNFEKHRSSPASQQVVVSACDDPAPAGAGAAATEEDGRSSHYSDEDFELPDED